MSVTGALAAVLLSGCVFGAQPGSFGPAGVQLELTTLRPHPLSPVYGELLAADDSGLVVHTATGVVRVLYPSIAAARIKQMLDWSPPARPGLPAMLRLRDLSRYPQGLSGELLDRVLRAYGSDSLPVIRP